MGRFFPLPPARNHTFGLYRADGPAGLKCQILTTSALPARSIFWVREMASTSLGLWFHDFLQA